MVNTGCPAWAACHDPGAGAGDTPTQKKLLSRGSFKDVVPGGAQESDWKTKGGWRDGGEREEVGYILSAHKCAATMRKKTRKHSPRPVSKQRAEAEITAKREQLRRRLRVRIRSVHTTTGEKNNVQTAEPVSSNHTHTHTADKDLPSLHAPALMEQTLQTQTAPAEHLPPAGSVHGRVSGAPSLHPAAEEDVPRRRWKRTGKELQVKVSSRSDGGDPDLWISGGVDAACARTHARSETCVHTSTCSGGNRRSRHAAQLNIHCRAHTRAHLNEPCVALAY